MLGFRILPRMAHWLAAISITCFVYPAYADGEVPKPIATVQDLMLSMVDPSADNIWEAVSTVVTINGVEEKHPASEEEWRKLRIDAIRLVESANLLLMKRAVAGPGIKSENPGIELEPEDSEALINVDRESWNAMVLALYQESEVMLDAIDRKDTKKIFDHGEKLDAVCEACHRKYWYPENMPKR